jgi:hypothetical protein
MKAARPMTVGPRLSPSRFHIQSSRPTTRPGGVRPSRTPPTSHTRTRGVGPRRRCRAAGVSPLLPSLGPSPSLSTTRRRRRRRLPPSRRPALRVRSTRSQRGAAAQAGLGGCKPIKARGHQPRARAVVRRPQH